MQNSKKTRTAWSNHIISKKGIIKKEINKMKTKKE